MIEEQVEGGGGDFCLKRECIRFLNQNYHLIEKLLENCVNQDYSFLLKYQIKELKDLENKFGESRLILKEKL